ncbi:MAG: hypothetical protein IPM37_14840 [Hahellaceae bacterium]|nr:hypothetical protein [Hahellaceae bacterium]
MISKPEPTLSNLNTEALSVAELRALVGRFEQILTEKDAQIQVLDQTIGQLDESLRQTIKRRMPISTNGIAISSNSKRLCV